jgi:hypothetical protein
MPGNQEFNQSPQSPEKVSGFQGLKKSPFVAVLLKAAVLFIIFNLVFALLNPTSLLGKISAYNWLIPGRQRLPFGEVQDKAYNLSLYQLDAMFLSHNIAAHKPPDEYRVVVIGDSSVWGYLLNPNQTLTAYLNAANLTTPDGKQVKFYNLGYPTISLTKDLLILNYAMRFQPDMVIWLTSLEAFPNSKQLSSPIVQNNPAPLRSLIHTYDLQLNPQDSKLVDLNFWEKTIIGQRRNLADLFRLQLYGVLWAATGIDQYYPETYERPQNDLEADERFYDLVPPVLHSEDLAFDVLAAGVKTVNGIPVLIINEPVFISQGANSNIRYNFFYPRWAYDQYRTMLAQFVKSKGWAYLDLWDIIPSGEFTNSAIHMTPSGTARLAGEIIPTIKKLLDQTNAP